MTRIGDLERAFAAAIYPNRVAIVIWCKQFSVLFVTAPLS